MPSFYVAKQTIQSIEGVYFYQDQLTFLASSGKFWGLLRELLSPGIIDLQGVTT